MENLIFASTGPKPKIVLRDAVNNDLQITENAEQCLVYDRALGEEGLTWRHLTTWWAARDSLSEEEDCPRDPDREELDEGHGWVIRRSIWVTDAGASTSRTSAGSPGSGATDMTATAP